tara:strand:+ start:398 stop:583 length:186 start_codon:yes stop_codon:yes gene_type:complete
MTPAKQRKNEKVEILTIKVIVNESSVATAKERENFFIGYIDNIPGCEVHYTKVEKAEVIDL